MAKTRTAIALLAGLALLAVAPQRARGAASGLNINVNGTVDPQYQASVNWLQPSWARLFIGWSTVEPAPGRYNQAVIDELGQAFAQLPPGTRIDAVVVSTPAWATASGQGGSATPPVDPRSYAQFMHYLAGHFAGVVDAWEIWNEPDSGGWWSGSAAQYAQLLAAAYPAIKAADPSATVVSGGLVGNDYGYLQQIYAAGARGSFDAVGIHTDTGCNTTSPYSYLRDPNGRIDRFSFLGYREVHATMAANGDGAKPIYMTEFGWSTTSIACPSGPFAGQKAGGVSEQDQASFLSQAYHCLSGDPYVRAAMWFAFQDAGSRDSDVDRFGLVRGDLSQKPAYAAFQRYSLYGDQLSGACGTFTGPRISIVAPRTGVRYRSALRISVTASSTVGVPRITLLHDGIKIRNFTSHAAPSTLSGTLNWQGAKRLGFGKHLITVQAIDKIGNTTSQSVTVTHVRAKHHKRPRHKHS